ncbi:hypothetical protein EON64_12620, partial [archaeon]
MLIWSQCLFLSGDCIRAVSILERGGVTAASALERASGVVDRLLGEPVVRAASREELLLLDSALLLAQCLVRAGELSEALGVLTGVLGSHAATDSRHTIYLFDTAQAEALQSTVHVLAALFCLAGRCLVSRDQQRAALQCWQGALRVHPRCLEAFEALARSPLLGFEEKEQLLL